MSQVLTNGLPHLPQLQKMTSVNIEERRRMPPLKRWATLSWDAPPLLKRGAPLLYEHCKIMTTHAQVTHNSPTCANKPQLTQRDVESSQNIS